MANEKDRTSFTRVQQIINALKTGKFRLYRCGTAKVMVAIEGPAQWRVTVRRPLQLVAFCPKYSLLRLAAEVRADFDADGNLVASRYGDYPPRKVSVDDLKLSREEQRAIAAAAAGTASYRAPLGDYLSKTIDRLVDDYLEAAIKRLKESAP